MLASQMRSTVGSVVTLCVLSVYLCSVVGHIAAVVGSKLLQH
jgi:hypothetical protein